MLLQQTLRRVTAHRWFARLDSTLALMLAVSLLLYGGVFLLGYGTDGYQDLDTFRSNGPLEILLHPAFNRYPLWGFVVYPVLLAVPIGLAHLINVLVHTIGSALLAHVVRGFGFNQQAAVLSGLLYLIWPGHFEALHWVAAGMFPFGFACLVGGVLLLLKDRFRWGSALLLAAILFSEGMLFPGLLLLLVANTYRNVSRWHTALVGGGLLAVFALLQVFRLITNWTRELTPYEVGNGRILLNLIDYLAIASGLGAARDINRLWTGSSTPFDPGLLLPQPFLIAALGLTLFAVYAAGLIPGTVGAAPGRRRVLLLLLVCALGFVASMLIYLPLTGNKMENRYATVAYAFVLVPIGVLLGWLTTSGRRPLIALGLTLAVLLGGWSTFKAWSNIYVNWWPTAMLNERLIEDLRFTQRETNTRHIILIDEPRMIGNAYAISGDWGYGGVARQYLGRDVVLESDRISNMAALQTPAGTRFAEPGCVFLGWRDGRRVVTDRAQVVATNLVFNCSTGLIEPPDGRTALEYYNHSRTSRRNLEEFLGHNPTIRAMLRLLSKPRTP